MFIFLLLTNIVPTTTRLRNVVGLDSCSNGQYKSNEICFSTLNVDVLRHPPFSSDMATNDLILFRSLQTFLAEGLLNDAEAVKTCLYEVFN